MDTGDLGAPHPASRGLGDAAAPAPEDMETVPCLPPTPLPAPSSGVVNDGAADQWQPAGTRACSHDDAMDMPGTESIPRKRRSAAEPSDRVSEKWYGDTASPDNEGTASSHPGRRMHAAMTDD